MTICHAAAVDYRTRLGWRAHVVGTTVWLTPGGRVEAFNVPRDVGERTLTKLLTLDIRPPVINIPGPPDRWALLTQSYDGAVGDLVALCAEHDIGYAYSGHHDGQSSEWGIDLPPTRHPGHDALSWVTQSDTPLPPAGVVVHTLISVLRQ